MKEWNSFNKGIWCNSINVRDFIENNYTYYDKEETFLEDKTEKTKIVWDKCT